MADQLQLEFPFLELQPFEVVFGGIPNYEKVVEAVPPEFYNSNEWSDVAHYIFRNELTATDMEQMGNLFRTDSGEVMKAQFAYLRAWLGSYKPSHQVKTAVCGWLMSLMFTAVPQLGN